MNTEALTKLQAHLERIAKRNHDELKALAVVDDNKVKVTVIETAESHELTSGKGDTLEAACAEVEADLPDSLASWSYEYVR